MRQFVYSPCYLNGWMGEGEWLIQEVSVGSALATLECWVYGYPILFCTSSYSMVTMMLAERYCLLISTECE